MVVETNVTRDDIPTGRQRDTCRAQCTSRNSGVRLQQHGCASSQVIKSIVLMPAMVPPRICSRNRNSYYSRLFCVMNESFGSLATTAGDCLLSQRTHFASGGLKRRLRSLRGHSVARAARRTGEHKQPLRVVRAVRPRSIGLTRRIRLKPI